MISCYVLLTDGIRTSDFGESLRFQKVLQGQEILGVNNPVDGINAQCHQLSELRRCYPGSNHPGITTAGHSTIPQVSSDLSCSSIGFSESFRFQKVLQGQEILPSQPYGRALSIDEAYGNGRFGAFDGYQMLRSRNGWSAQMNNNSSHLHAPFPSGQVSSPSSVLMFQQAVNPVSNSDYNIKSNHLMEGKTHQRGSYASEVKGGTFASFPSHETIFGGQAQEGTNSSSTLNLRDQLGSSRLHGSASVLRSSQELVSSCKSSCRVFGFSLTEGAPIASEEADPSTVSCQLDSGASFTRHCK